MKQKLLYVLILLISMVIPIVLMRTAMTAIAFCITLIAIFGAGRACYAAIFSSKDIEFNSFGIGFILLAATGFVTAMLELNAVYFMTVFIIAACYGLYWLLNYFRKDIADHKINWVIVLIYLLILALNIYPTLRIQGYSHDNIFSWVNNDAAGYTAIANQVKLGIYPITIPGFGIEKMYYHDGAYVTAGFIANIFHLHPADALFAVIRPLAVLSVLFSLVSIGYSAFNKTMRSYRIAGALIGFFLIGSLTSIFEYLPVHFARIDHGMKHLRGFLIGHSSLWIFAAMVPVISLLNDKIVKRKKINFLQFILLFLVVSCGGALNFVAAAICFFMLMFFVLLYNDQQQGNTFILKRNLAIISLPFVLLLAGVSVYLYLSKSSIETSAFFLPVFNLANWSNFLMIFFVLYIGLRLFGLNYFSSKTEIHFAYIQFIVLMATISLMILIGLFVEPKAGRENDIKYGYVIIEGVFGLFSGIWFAEIIGGWWTSKQKQVTITIANLVRPFAIVFSILLLIALTGFVNYESSPLLVNPFLKSVIIPLLILAFIFLISRYKKKIRVSKTFAVSFIGICCLLSMPGCLHEFNKYRSPKTNDEAFEVNAADIKLINELNSINKEHKLVLVAAEDPNDPNSGSGYTYSSLSDAPVVNEAANFFGVKNRKRYKEFKSSLDSFYTDKSSGTLKRIADRYRIAFFIFNKRLVDDSVFAHAEKFKLKSAVADSIYIVQYEK